MRDIGSALIFTSLKTPWLCVRPFLFNLSISHALILLASWPHSTCLIFFLKIFIYFSIMCMYMCVRGYTHRCRCLRRLESSVPWSWSRWLWAPAWVLVIGLRSSEEQHVLLTTKHLSSRLPSVLIGTVSDTPNSFHFLLSWHTPLVWGGSPYIPIYLPL